MEVRRVVSPFTLLLTCTVPVCTDCVCAIQKPQWCTVVLVCHMERVCMLLLVIGIVDRRAVNVPKQSARFI